MFGLMFRAISTVRYYCFVFQFIYTAIQFTVPTTTFVVSSSPGFVQVYSIQHYVIKFVSGLRHVGGIPRVLRFPPQIKLTTMI